MFHPDTRISRSKKPDATGKMRLFDVTCGECGDVFHAQPCDIRNGARYCSCSTFRQKTIYINKVTDNGLCVAIKVGIANNEERRLMQQNRRNSFKMKNVCSYEFEGVNDCKATERYIKKSFASGVVDRKDMIDGFTETFFVYDLDAIMECIVRMGGIKKGA